MTVKLTIGVEPVDECVRVTVEGSRDERQVFYQQFETPSVTQSTPIPVEYGDKVTIAVETGQKIVLDTDQFVVRLEDPNSKEWKEKREAEKKEQEEAQKKHEEDAKKRQENARKLEQRYAKEAKETEVPAKPVPNVPPLELEDEDESPKQTPVTNQGARSSRGLESGSTPKGR